MAKDLFPYIFVNRDKDDCTRKKMEITVMVVISALSKMYMTNANQRRIMDTICVCDNFCVPYFKKLWAQNYKKRYECNSYLFL
jgi:hypothetical protein